ncbi:AAA family ATPase [Candidatus Magnetaquicoccus inordinatus]|uniref:AAA family ATPase n=1 Tax=Candidatus Magnetaquicoccus inordinatus TaxID=2496818 RepID=UPI00102D20C6|nr:DUF3696 domain-containing protein [Candidatus Magnetaquicoccus inordinatus]
MILKALTLENFKGIRDPVRIEFAPITLLFGPNNAGKSTIIQALHYARELFERGNADPGRTLLGGDVLDLGGFDSLVHNHDRSRTIKMGFELDVSKEDLGDLEEWINVPTFGSAQFIKPPSQASLEIAIQWSETLQGPRIASCSIGYDGKALFNTESSVDGRRITFQVEDVLHPVMTWIGPSLRVVSNVEPIPLVEYQTPFSENRPLQIIASSVLPPGGKPLEFHDFGTLWEPEDDEQASWHQQILVISSLFIAPITMLRDSLRKFRYLSPFRDMPSRNHQPARAPDEFRWSNGMAAWDLLFLKGKTLVEKVNDWLVREDRLNSGYRLEVKCYKELEVNGPLMLALTGATVLDDEEWIRDAVRSLPERRQLLLRNQRCDVELFPQDVGVGISQVVPVLVAAIHTKTGIVAIEEPESNIHPAFQVALGDLFIAQTQEKLDLMFLVETHSEHLMLRFLRRIRETSENGLPPGVPFLTPEGIAVYFVEPEENGPRIHRIRIDKDGDFIDRWPRGFFQERMKELYGA